MATITFETRLCTLGNEELCGQWQGRAIGTPATYRAGINGWICFKCTGCLDPELEFACVPEQGEPRSLHRANIEFLNRFREVTPWHGQIYRLRYLMALRQVAVKADNTTLVELTDHACFTRDSAELEAVRQLYMDEELVGEEDSYQF